MPSPGVSGMYEILLPNGHLGSQPRFLRVSYSDVPVFTILLAVLGFSPL